MVAVEEVPIRTTSVVEVGRSVRDEVDDEEVAEDGRATG